MSVSRSTRFWLNARFRPRYQPPKPITTRLSILDSIAAPFPPANGVWIYDKPESKEQRQALSVSHLLKSLQRTIEAYPHWAGQLQPAPYEHEGDPKKRFGRLLVKHGADSDPGFEVLVTESSRRISDFVPSSAERTKGARNWNAGGFPQDELISTTPTAMHDGRTFEGLPVSSVQLTSFACGGTGVAFRIVHALADAGSMMLFMNTWAEINRAMAEKKSLPTPKPLFDPSLLEKATGGDLEAEKPDHDLLQISRSMPIQRLDRWLETESRPSFFEGPMDVTKPPGVTIDREELSPANPIPWEECDFLSPASNVQVHFSGPEMQKLWKKAMITAENPVSHLDALLAHLWQRLSVARQPDNSKDIFFNLVLGIRPRLSPPLPNDFLGSPTMHAYTALRPKQIIEGPLGAVAAAIRSTTARFNHRTLQALLHDFTYEAGAQRLWQFFLGSRQTTVTTWLRLGSSTLEFAPGHMPRHVHFLLPNTMDGVVKIMEAPPVVGVENVGVRKEKVKRHWSDDGVIVAMVMATKVMEQLLADPLLRGDSPEESVHPFKETVADGNRNHESIPLNYPVGLSALG